MGTDNRIKEIYDSVIQDITRSPENWAGILEVAGRLYRYEFDNIVMIYAQRPPGRSTLMADYNTWKKVGRYVKSGSKGCLIFPSRALDPHMRYVFDISDTVGRGAKLTWDLKGSVLKNYVDYLVSEGQVEQYRDGSRSSLENSLKMFTGTNVWHIIKEEFGGRMAGLKQLSGSVMKDTNEKRKGLQPDVDMEQLVYQSVMYAVGTRCGFGLSVQEQDFGQIVNIQDEEVVYRLGSLVCDVSCSVLREFGRNLKAMEKERSLSYGRRADLPRSRRAAVPGSGDPGRAGEGPYGLRQIREDGDALSFRERTSPVPDAPPVRDDGGEDGGGGRGGEPAPGPADGGLPYEAQAPGPVIDHGDVAAAGAGQGAGRGSGAPPGSYEVPLGAGTEGKQKKGPEWDHPPEQDREAGGPTQASLSVFRREQLQAPGQPQVPEQLQMPGPGARSFQYDLLEVEKGGPKTRYQWNVEAIRTLKQIEGEGRQATVQEQKTLAKYVGWGGLSQVFDGNNKNWGREYEELKGLLDKEEYQASRATVNNAFYTPPEVAMCINSALVQFGFRGGNVLEPSMGIGNFFGCLPAPMQKSRLYGVEIDSLSARIAKQLYPDAKISIMGFEDTEYPDNFFDVAVGNVPFGDYKVFDPKYNKYNFRIHDYFLAKAIDQVRPGGMVAVITTKGTLDKANPAIRRYLAQRAKLVGAVRLPRTAFQGNAGTEVTADVLFLQKRERKMDLEPDWVHLGVTEDGIAVNAYFAEHPEMVLGRMEYDTGAYGPNSRYTVCVNDDEGFSLYGALGRAISNIRAEMADFDRLLEEEQQTLGTIPADPDVRNYTYTFFEGELYYRENSQMVRREVPGATKRRIRELDGIRKITRGLIDLQMEGCSEEELLEEQKLLNGRYDRFVAQYGPINSKANKAAFRDDSDYPLLCSLEEVTGDGEVKKADMFYKQTIKAKKAVDRVETAVEALNVSVNEFGYVNIPYMLSIYGPDIPLQKEGLAGEANAGSEGMASQDGMPTRQKREALIHELRGLVYLNPARYHKNNPDAGWETADEYLSGNVRDKLRVARAMAAENPQFLANVEALEKVQPEWVEASDIDVRIGTTWIDPEDYEQFIYGLLGTPAGARAIRSKWYNGGIQVHLNKITMEWFVENKSLDKKSVAATTNYGTSRMDAYSIFEDTLNLKAVTVRDRVEDADGGAHYVVNKNETTLAREKQNLMKERFKGWLFENPVRRQKYVEYYNETFNNTRLREYDGSHLTFPGMNPEIVLKPHQKNAVARILLGGNTLLAHCVGAGKSFEMMAACMEQKRLGLANKTVLVVPKPLIGQTASEFLRLYPSANILVATERDFERSRRKQFVSRIATGDYDCVVMSHSQFESTTCC